MSEDELVDEMSEVLRTGPKCAEKLGRAHRERFESGSRAEEADAYNFLVSIGNSLRQLEANNLLK